MKKNTKVKICGLKREEDIAYVNECLPDFAGFVFYEKSSRYVSIERAKELIALLDPCIIPVAVFLNASIEDIRKVANTDLFPYLQVHGEFDNAYIEQIRGNKKVIQAFKVETTEDITKALSSCADFILFDHGDGGSGTTFDWSLLQNINRDFFLAGGLSERNVAEAIKCVKPYAVDVSSNVETEKVKDYAKIKAFINAVRCAEEENE